jgi:spermidine/putrescine transport system substrate-binding protein
MNNLFKIFSESFFYKILIIIFYSFLFAAFLYFPKVFEYLSDENSINVYTFTEFISAEAVNEFEKETGIKVRVQYFEFNEELFAKFRINQGEGYDLITPSDYMVELMCKDNMLQQIDKSVLLNFKNIDRRLLGRFFDRGNKYSVPLCWLVYGVVYNRDILGNNFRGASLDMLFRDPWDLVASNQIRKYYKVCMLQDPREIFYLAAIYLYGRVENISQEEAEGIQELLIRQKSWVESYTDVSVPYFLASDIASVAMITSHRMKKLQELGSSFVFEVPREGGMLAIENLAIPAKTKKTAIVLKFIDFLLSKRVQALHSNLYGTNPSNIFAIDGKNVENPNFFPRGDIFDKLHIANNEISLDKIDMMWMKIRFS